MQRIILIQDNPEIVKPFLEYFQQYPTLFQIIMLTPTPTFVGETKSNIIYLPIEPTSLQSWQEYLQSSVYLENPVLSTVQDIVVLCYNWVAPDIRSQHILSVLHKIIYNTKIFPQTPKIYCEVHDNSMSELLESEGNYLWQRNLICGEIYAHSIACRYKKNVKFPASLSYIIPYSYLPLHPYLSFLLGGIIGMMATFFLQQIF